MVKISILHYLIAAFCFFIIDFDSYAPSIINDDWTKIEFSMLRTSSDGVDGGAAAIAKQRGFTLVRPDDGWFPGLGKLREELAGHQWIFGKTPRFKVRSS